MKQSDIPIPRLGTLVLVNDTAGWHAVSFDNRIFCVPSGPALYLAWNIDHVGPVLLAGDGRLGWVWAMQRESQWFMYVPVARDDAQSLPNIPMA